MRTRSLSLVAGLLLAAAAPALAEVSVEQGRLQVLARGGLTWAPVRSDARSGELLNPFGDARGDGVPSVAVNPVTGAPEAAWGLGGAEPGLAFARHEAGAGWEVLRVPTARAGSRWAGRRPQLTHDLHGNSWLLYEDAESGQVLLASVARDGQRVNPPLVLSTPQRPGTSPAMHWDGEELVVAFVRADSPDRLEVHGLRPEWDADGRIPDGGEGIPGIPEPIFGYAGLPGSLQSSRPLGEPGTSAPALGGSARVDLGGPPPLLELEPLGDGRLLVSWIVDDRLLWSERAGGQWSEVDWIELADPLLHGEAREQVRGALQGRVQPVTGRPWLRGRRLPGAQGHDERR